MGRAARPPALGLVAVVLTCVIATASSAHAGSQASTQATAPSGTPAPGEVSAEDDVPATPSGRVFPGANIARVVFPTRATVRPGRGRVVARLRPLAPLGGGPTQLRIVAQKVVRDRLYVRVLLAKRPNGAAGWISGDDVVLLRSRYRVWINRTHRTLSVTRAGRRIKRFKAVIGKPSSPTPRGEFAITELLAQRPPDDFLGTWILPLTAYSGTYREFDGGPGRVAIHGRAGASLLDPLGSAASHGCIRISNQAVGWLARRVSPGTAVIVR